MGWGLGMEGGRKVNMLAEEVAVHDLYTETIRQY